MNAAFWDTSALVPLCVQHEPGPAVRQLVEQFDMAVWWATPVEMRSAFERLSRTGHLSAPEHAAAGARLAMLRRGWRELQPTEALRSRAESLLMSHPLKAADALQLGAACIWSADRPQDFAFISADRQLLEAARQVGFNAVTV